MRKECDRLSGNRDDRVVKGFGEEWSRFSQEALSDVERSEIFTDYFSIFPWHELPEAAHGVDVGCGSGRWAVLVAPRVCKLTCVDASVDALEVAQCNLEGQNNVAFRRADVGKLPFLDSELDFAYSLGVLHHVPDTLSAIKEVARILRPGGVFLVYLYYAFDNRPLWFRLSWQLADGVRKIISRMPTRMRFAFCDIIAVLVYWPMSCLASSVSRLGMSVEHFPLAYYRDKSLYVMRTDALDRFGTRLEKRFRREQIENMLGSSGFRDVRFSSKAPYWCAVAWRR